MISIVVPDGDSVQLDRRFSAVKVASRYYLRAALPEKDGGWYSIERQVRTPTVWQWTAESARLLVDNPQDRPLRVVFRFDLRSLEARTLALRNGPAIAAAGLELGPERTWIWILPPSRSPPETIRWNCGRTFPPTTPRGDARGPGFSDLRDRAPRSCTRRMRDLQLLNRRMTLVRSVPSHPTRARETFRSALGRTVRSTSKRKPHSSA